MQTQTNKTETDLLFGRLKIRLWAWNANNHINIFPFCVCERERDKDSKIAQIQILYHCQQIGKIVAIFQSAFLYLKWYFKFIDKYGFQLDFCFMAIRIDFGCTWLHFSVPCSDAAAHSTLWLKMANFPFAWIAFSMDNEYLLSECDQPKTCTVDSSQYLLS